MTLDKLKTGECGRIISVRGEGELRHHLLDMGLTPGTEVSLRKTAPMGDPVQLVLRGYELTLRLAEAAKIEIVSIESMTETKKENERHQPIAHPGVGELGKARDYRKNRIGGKIKISLNIGSIYNINDSCRLLIQQKISCYDLLAGIRGK